MQVTVVTAVPLLQCGGGALRAPLGSAGPVRARSALLLHPVGYCLRVVEVGPPRVPLTLVGLLSLESSGLATWATVR